MDTNYSTDNRLVSQGVTVPLSLEQATNHIIERARQLVHQLVEERGHDKPPFLPEEYARLQGIERIVKADLGKTSALLLRFHNGYVIKVNQSHNLARQNFSCAHEIGHLLLGELKLERCIQSIEYRTFNPQGQAKARARASERLCDIAAAELLMPECVFRKYLKGFCLSIGVVERMASIFGVSISAAALRIAEISTEPCIVLLWRRIRQGKSNTIRLAWSAKPGRQKKSINDYTPVHKVVRPPSILHKAYETKPSIKSNKLFSIGNAVKRLPMESKGFGFGENRHVVSLAFPSRVAKDSA